MIDGIMKAGMRSGGHPSVNRESLVTIRTIGEGGTGIVDEVWPSGASDPVARKRLTEWVRRGPGSQENLKRFKREVRLLRDELDHPNIIKVISADLEGDDPFFLMELGRNSLESEVPHGGVSEGRARELFVPILAAMAYAHSKGILHRDLKPHNILMINERPVVADFGLGRQVGTLSSVLTAVGTFGGTAGYVAPEQWRDFHNADERADIFALGSLLYFMLTGLDLSTFDARSIPRTYRQLVLRCREVDPAKRYSTAQELWSAFNELTTISPLERESLSYVDQAMLLLETAVTDRGNRLSLIDLYIVGRSDYELFYKTIGSWTGELLKAVAIDAPEDLAKIVEGLPEHLPRHFPFSYLDVLARFLENVWDASDDLDVRQAVVISVLRIGSDFDENDMGQAFRLIAGKATDRADVLLVTEVLRTMRDEAAWASSYLKSGGAAGPILRALNDAKEANAEDLR